MLPALFFPNMTVPLLVASGTDGCRMINRVRHVTVKARVPIRFSLQNFPSDCFRHHAWFATCVWVSCECGMASVVSVKTAHPKNAPREKKRYGYSNHIHSERAGCKMEIPNPFAKICEKYPSSVRDIGRVTVVTLYQRDGTVVWKGITPCPITEKPPLLPVQGFGMQVRKALVFGLSPGNNIDVGKNSTPLCPSGYRRGLLQKRTGPTSTSSTETSLRWFCLTQTGWKGR